VKKYERFYGWNKLGIMMSIIVMTMGFPLFVPGVINAVMAKEMALPCGAMGLGFTVAVIAGGLPSPLVAHVI
jgi:hypothetical protein